MHDGRFTLVRFTSTYVLYDNASVVVHEIDLGLKTGLETTF